MLQTKTLRRAQLDKNFAKINGVLSLFKRPRSGWVKEIREALGMSMQDLGQRMGVIKQRIERIEKDEVSDKVTLETMKKVAEALDCEFIYVLVPKSGTLQESLENQAKIVASKILESADATMKLENQATSKQSKLELEKKIVRELLEKEDRRIWK
jgi:predicted DNA-binding mobile mystery protein A